MNTLIIFSVAVFFAVVQARPDDQYPTKYDNINIDDIIKNERLLRSYVDCLLEKGKCNSEGTTLKKFIPDALQTDCSKCSERQKEGSKKLIHHLYDHKRDWWNELEAKYDQEGTYVKKYSSEFN